MVRICSYAIPIESQFEIALPLNARILTVHEQRGQPRLWAMVDEEEPDERRRFYVAGSDTDIKFDPDICNYIGSFQAAGDVLVFHVFAASVPRFGTETG